MARAPKAITTSTSPLRSSSSLATFTSSSFQIPTISLPPSTISLPWLHSISGGSYLTMCSKGGLDLAPSPANKSQCQHFRRQRLWLEFFIFCFSFYFIICVSPPTRRLSLSLLTPLWVSSESSDFIWTVLLWFELCFP